MDGRERLETGWNRAREVAGEEGIVALKGLMAEWPAFGEIVVAFGFGEIYMRPALEDKAREIATITALVCLGDTADQLRFHYRSAMRNGFTQELVVELLIHCMPYVGIPRVMNALRILSDVVREQGRV